MPHSGAMVKIDRGGGVAVFCGSIDIGQGSDSVLAYVVAEVLGIRPEDVRVVTADTDLTPVDLGSYSSRVTLMTGNAAREAAEKLREPAPRRGGEEARGLARGPRGPRPADLPCGTTRPAGSPSTRRRGWRRRPTGRSSPPAPTRRPGAPPSSRARGSARRPRTPTRPAPWSSRSIRRPVTSGSTTCGSPTTGGRRSTRSSSRARSRARSTWGSGRPSWRSRPSASTGSTRSRRMLEYKSPTTLETPEITTLLVETRDPEGPFGAKEAGQGPLLPVIPAVANAVYDAIGVRIDEVPITPEKILKALDRKAQGKAPRVGPERLPARRVPRADPRSAALGRPRRARGRRGPRKERPARERRESGVAPGRRPSSMGGAPAEARRGRADDAASALPVLRAAERGRGGRAPRRARPRGRGGRRRHRPLSQHEAAPDGAAGAGGPPRDPGAGGNPGERAGRPGGRAPARRSPASRSTPRSPPATRPSRGRPAWSRRPSSATWGRSAATSASTRAATTTTSPTSGAGRSASA